MKVFVPKDPTPTETRAALVPDTVRKLVELGAEVEIESGLGDAIDIADEVYTKAGATIAADARQALGAADIVLSLNKPPIENVESLKEGCIHVSYLDPFGSDELIEALRARGVSAISMELIPRTTLAQKMDALSSQASLAGYVAVILAAGRLKKILPMMMTPAGTIAPTRVLIIGAGVAGLQAIATAKRLGARVEAYDTRPVVEEQVQSLGAKFLKIDVGETGQTEGGYAKELTEDQLRMQREAMAKFCANADIVITTAQVFGRKAPRILSAEMVAGMRPGSVIVDMAVESGGNVEGSRLDEEVDANGVTIIGLRNLAGRVAADASQMYSSNLGNLLEHFWDEGTKTFRIDLEDEIMKGCLVTHGGEVVNETAKSAKS